MFVYSCSGFTVTISLPTFTIIFPKIYESSEHFEKFLNLYQQSIASNSPDRVTVIRDKYHPIHDWCHPPKDSPRYRELYDRKFFGVLPAGELIHYHFCVPSKNPEKVILEFLYLLATQTEQGQLLHLSLKDLADLKWHYQQYCQKFGLEQFSEATTRLALNFVKDEARYEEDDQVVDAANDYMSSLSNLRQKIEANIGVEKINLEELQIALNAANLACNGQDQTFLKVADLGKHLLRVLAKGYEKSIPLQSMINQNTLFALDQCPANQRKDFRYTNENIVVLLAFIINASILASHNLIDEKFKLSVVGLTLLSLILFDATQYAAQEPRHLIRSGSRMAL